MTPSAGFPARDAGNSSFSGDGPAFLEFRTYRFRAHSMFDAELYRDKTEVEEWKKRDPIATFTAGLKERGEAAEAILDALDASVNDEIDVAVQFAEDGTWEPAEGVLKDIYTPAFRHRSHPVGALR